MPVLKPPTGHNAVQTQRAQFGARPYPQGQARQQLKTSTVTLDTGGSGVVAKNIALEDLLAASSHYQESSLADKLKSTLSNLPTPIESVRFDQAHNQGNSFAISKAVIEKSSLAKQNSGQPVKVKDNKLNAY